ncbi:MAG: hypothetical protein K2M19_00755 [Muribaculaceae bacterium]|nr:hypothetical protein [Muribaculaceae bacterium]
MNNLKNIFKTTALAAVAAIALAGCNNRAPFERLNAAVDSTQVELAKLNDTGIPSMTVSYDEITNSVVYNVAIDADLSLPEVEQNFKAQMPVMEAGIIQSLLMNDRFGLGKEIICAGADIKLELKGSQGGNLEAVIDNSKVLEAYDQVFGEGKAAELRASQND